MLHVYKLHVSIMINVSHVLKLSLSLSLSLSHSFSLSFSFSLSLSRAHPSPHPIDFSHSLAPIPPTLFSFAPSHTLSLAHSLVRACSISSQQDEEEDEEKMAYQIFGVQVSFLCIFNVFIENMSL